MYRIFVILEQLHCSIKVKLQMHGDEKLDILSTNTPVITINGGDIADYSFEIGGVDLGEATIAVSAEAENAR